MKILKKSIRKILRSWAKIGIAPGLLHQVVDRHSSQLYTKPLIRAISGKNHVVCDLRDHVQSRIYFFGAYEPIEAFLFTKLIQPDMHIVDAGANIGFYSLLSSSKLSDRGRVFAFEPIPSNLEKLKTNIAQSGRTRIEVIESGLWDKQDLLTFSLSQDQAQNQGSFTANPTSNPDQQFSCPVNTLDSFIDSEVIPKVDLIKMDIEGAELFAIRGAQKTLETHKPSILMEINQEACKAMGYSSEEIDKLLLPLGYKIFHIESLPTESGYIESTKDLVQTNVLFLSPKDQNLFSTTWNYKDIKKGFASNKA